jgi:hypothetical protein
MNAIYHKASAADQAATQALRAISYFIRYWNSDVNHAQFTIS